MNGCSDFLQKAFIVIHRLICMSKMFVGEGTKNQPPH